MKLPSFRPRKNAEEPVSDERILAEARELAQSRLQQCIADLHERIQTPPDTAERSAGEEIDKAAA